MADPTTPPALDALARLAASRAYGGLPDRRLLDRFAAARAVLRHEQDAEDVFQAAFLVLARKAATIRQRDALGCWLHGVARRIALRAVRARARRARHEAVPRPQPAP